MDETNEAVDEVGHTHADISGGWLRAATFGAMDGLVTNLSLVAGVGAAGASTAVVLTAGLAGLVAGAFSMALGEYASVSTQNEAIDKEVAVEGREIRENPTAEIAELAELFVGMGMSGGTAAAAAAEVHQDHDTAVRLHVSQELGVDPDEKASPLVAAVSSFVMFSIGAVIPLLPYLLGRPSLAAGLLCGGAGLLVAGGVASYFTATTWWWGALRQLLYGALAASATYAVGTLLGVGIAP
ncbi:VIT1/CCC1 transporter family protein [Nocardioides bigeumensis]|uniref:VIT1/CCC1 transporter family protein n=1 Tax=Nocardioides bigeumensis TaxID=433657 RepID=A0ABN2Y3S8_9ACTN